MEDLRKKTLDELERVVQCREMARCAWKYKPSVNHGVNDARLHSLAQFNEVVLALKEALNENNAGMMQKALELSQVTP